MEAIDTTKCPEQTCIRGIEVTLEGNHLAYTCDFSGIQFTFCPICGKKLEECHERNS
jgi:hypothetical protein